MKRDERKLIDTRWDDARAKGFLGKPPADLPGAPDFPVRGSVCQSMRVGGFGRSAGLCAGAGPDVAALNAGGEDAAAHIVLHADAAPCIDAPRRAGGGTP